MTQNTAVPPYMKDHRFEEVLADINEALYPLEVDCVSRFEQPHYPVVFIAGTQRSGTTLVMQLLIASFKVGYVSNLMARFWKAPYIGALLAGELRRKQRPQAPDFQSELGTSYGYDGPHEFGYFWRRWFPYSETHETNDEDLSNMDVTLFRKELHAMESVFDAPLAFKNPIVFSLNIVALADILPTAVFVVCYRQPLYVAQSTLLARLKFHGRKDLWWSIRPDEYTWLKDRPYPEQIAGQIFYSEQRVKESLAKIDSHRWMTIEYEELCAHPERELGRIRRMVARAGYDLVPSGYTPAPFKSTNVQGVDDEEFNRLSAACDRWWATGDGESP
jgi:hypothetical protein